MKIANLSKLQKLINRAVKANNEAFTAGMNLNDFCASEYGFIPSEYDLDEIIDSCYGGSGLSNGMTANQFDSIMRKMLEKLK